MPKQQKTVLAVLIVVSLVAAAGILAQRARVERANRTVAIAVDYDRVHELAALAGSPVAAVLRRMKAAGATHTVLNEETLDELVISGRVRVEVTPQGTTLRPVWQVSERVLHQLALRVPGGRLLPGPEPAMQYKSSTLAAPLRALGMGYDEEAVADAAAARLRVVVRPLAEYALTPQGVDAALEAAHAAGAEVVIFGGVQVLGMDNLLEYTAQKLDQLGLRYGYIEMAKQYGEMKLAAALKCKLVRCHALTVPEMQKVPPERAVERFLLAVRERNVRLCYIRPYSLANADPLSFAVHHTAEIAQELTHAGFTAGTPEPFPNLSLPKPLLALCVMGAGAALIWLLQLIWLLPPATFRGLVIADVVLSAGLAFASASLAGAVGALAAAVLFPTLAFAGLDFREPGGRARLWPGVAGFLALSGIGLAAGLLIAACQSDLPHMMEIATFRGVKLAQGLPIALIFGLWIARSMGSYYALRTEMGRGLPEWPALRAGLVEAGQSVVRYWHSIVVVLALGALALMLVRSGNVSPVPPSDVELKVRSFLENTLVIRPRSKEILIGHPALIIGLALLLAGRRRGVWALLVIGAVGQVSLINTFGHIHTPLWVSLVRVFHGVWLGVVAAALMWVIGGWLGRVVVGKRRAPEEPPQPPKGKRRS